MFTGNQLIAVVVVLVIILAGLFCYLIYIDTRLKKWEKLNNLKNKNLPKD
jgi:hypothetical protein